MKAMVLREPGEVHERRLEARDVARPEPGPDDLLLRVRCCGVCRTDLHLVEGELALIRRPVIPGHQIVGEVVGGGANASGFPSGELVGVSWLHHACGECGYCASTPSRENLCDKARFTGWTVDGGYAEYATVPQAYAYALPAGVGAEQIAPLLCGGIIGYRALRLCGIQPGERLGLYGFGSAAHIAIQVARHRGCEVYVYTRSRGNQELARRLGASWAGSVEESAGEKVHAAIIFAPAGELVPAALQRLERGGTVALAGIYMSPIPPLDYTRHLYDERILRSVANSTRQDARELLELAAEIPIRTSVRVYPLEEANEALIALKDGKFAGSAALRCG